MNAPAPPSEEERIKSIRTLLNAPIEQTAPDNHAQGWRRDCDYLLTEFDEKCALLIECSPHLRSLARQCEACEGAGEIVRVPVTRKLPASLARTASRSGISSSVSSRLHLSRFLSPQPEIMTMTSHSDSPTAEQRFETRWSIMLARSLTRLHEAIKECGSIGFQESSPTKNAHHASIWLNLNEAQKDAALKLKTYSDAQNAILRQQIASDPDDDPSAGNAP